MHNFSSYCKVITRFEWSAECGICGYDQLWADHSYRIKDLELICTTRSRTAGIGQVTDRDGHSTRFRSATGSTILTPYSLLPLFTVMIEAASEPTAKGRLAKLIALVKLHKLGNE